MIGILACLVFLGISLGSVIELTDENFDRLTAESEKDFLIDIYAPW